MILETCKFYIPCRQTCIAVPHTSNCSRTCDRPFMMGFLLYRQPRTRVQNVISILHFFIRGFPSVPGSEQCSHSPRDLGREFSEGLDVLAKGELLPIACLMANVSFSFFSFNVKVPGVLSSLLDGACTVRSDLTHNNLGILFELCVTYIRSVSPRFSCYSPDVKLF